MTAFTSKRLQLWICSEHDVWRLNVAHTYFMQDNHYKVISVIAYRSPTPSASSLLKLLLCGNLCARCLPVLNLNASHLKQL